MSTKLGKNGDTDRYDVPVGMLVDEACDQITASAGEAHSVATYTNETTVLICADTPVRYKIGVSATATAASNIIGAYVPLTLRIPAGGRVSIYGTGNMTVARFQ